MRSLAVGEPRWTGPLVGPVTRATGLQISRGLAFVSLVVGALCGWSAVQEPSTRWYAGSCLALFLVLTLDQATSPLQARHAAMAGAGLILSWWVADPTASGGAFPGELALPAALMTCAATFDRIRAWCWIGLLAAVSAVLLVALDLPSEVRLSGLVLQVGMVFAAGALASALHDTVTRTDHAQTQIVAEMSEQAVLAERRRAQAEVVDVLHGAVSDALRAVRDGHVDPDRTRAECAAAYAQLSSAARWQDR